MKKLNPLLLTCCLLVGAPATSAVIVLDFEGAGDTANLSNFYNGGTDSLGNSGTNYGVQFGANSRTTIDADAGGTGTGNIANEPSPNTVMYYETGSAILNYAPGFDTGFSFFYSSIAAATVKVYDGLNATGNLLAIINLSAQYRNNSCQGDPTGDYCNWTAAGASFGGIAKSIDFTGAVNGIAYDNITFGSATATGTPNPSSTPTSIPTPTPTSTPTPEEITKNEGQPQNGSCVGNPCNPATGNKYHAEEDYQNANTGLTLSRYYNSTDAGSGALGAKWSFNHGASLKVDWGSLGSPQCITTVNTTASRIVNVRRSDGSGVPFSCVPPPSAAYYTFCTGQGDHRVRLTEEACAFKLLLPDGGSERYSLIGKLLSTTDPAGRVTNYAYNAGLLTKVTGPFGHTLTFGYKSGSSRVDTVTDSNNKTIGYYYDTRNNLFAILYPDLNATKYFYADIRFPNNLTGVAVGAAGLEQQFATYAYNASGKAITTQHDNDFGRPPQELFTLNYDSDAQTTVTDAVGMTEIFGFTTTLGVKNLTSKVNQSDGKSVQQKFDGSNNLICRKDEENRVTVYTYNATNQRTSMTEGLVGDCTNSVSVPGVTRTTGYQYQSTTLDVPKFITSPSIAGSGYEKSVEMVYEDTRFPYLPTRINERGYTPSGVYIARSTALGYNSQGQVSTIDGPRSPTEPGMNGVNDITTLEYYICKTGGNCGQLKSVTNALGHVTTYDLYDANGRLLQTTDPNGLVTIYVYNARGQVSFILVTPPGGTTSLIKSIRYTSWGAVLDVTYPDDYELYNYDAAHNLVSVSNNAGSAVYDYDLKGNRDGEKILNGDMTLVRTLGYTHDLRNRLKTINAGGSISQLTFDAVGNLAQETDPNNNAPTRYTSDALNRLVETIDRMNGSTAYGYDVNGRLIRAKAPNNATTTYAYDDMGNLLKESSPDRGTTNYTHDTAGNVVTQTDARGIVVAYTYDPLNRLTFVDYPAAAEDVTLKYDQSGTADTSCTAGIGRLCRVVDPSGITNYAYDVFGNLLTETHSRGATLRYSYDIRNRLSTITYPSGMIITYGRDTAGRIQKITRTADGVDTDIVSNRLYRADGALISQTWGNGLPENRRYDLQGRLQHQDLGAVDVRDYLQYDANGNLKQISATGNSTSNFNFTYTYDVLDRLRTDTSGSSTATSSTDTFGYDANGNRSSHNAPTGGAQTYVYSSSTNRLNTMNGRSFVLDAAGNTKIDYSNVIKHNRNFIYHGAGTLQKATVYTSTVTHTADYTYDYRGQRRNKSFLSRGLSMDYLYGQSGELLAERSGNTVYTEYVYVDGVPVAQYRYAPDPMAPITAAPRITGFWPGSGGANTTVFVFGRDFINKATSVKLNGVNAPIIQVLDSTLLFFLVPAGATSGPIEVTTENGSHTSSANFGTPATGVTINGIWPSVGGPGTPVFVFGSGFEPMKTQATFIGPSTTLQAPILQVLDATLLFVIVPAGAAPGYYQIQLTTPSGSTISSATFLLDTAVPINNTLLYLHTDHQGTPRSATNSLGTVVWRNNGQRGTAFGDAIPDGSVTINLRFPGQYYDWETGLHYNGRRYYDSGVGRYITSDPIGLAGGLNTYAYVRNNPLRWVDPAGLELTFGQQLIVNTATGVGSAVGSLVPNPLGPLGGGAIGGAIAGGVATWLMPGSTGTDIVNNTITGGISGAAGAGIGALAEGVAANSGRAAILTGVLSGLLDAIGMQAPPPINSPANSCP